jgi:starvation-inducible DNA-binding protein
MEPNIGMTPQQRKDSADLLNTLLADEAILYIKTLNYHWNIISPHFGAMHEFFKEQYEALLTMTDDVAERARALGHPALGTMASFLSTTTLKEQPGVPAEPDMIKNLLNDHETIIRYIRTHQQTVMEKNNDPGTNNFLCDLMEKHEKMAWMLRSFLGIATH